MNHFIKKEVWFVYDGDCPLCRNAALALKIKKEYGTLNLLNAREEKGHPVIQEINTRRYDLDEGMVIYDGMDFYHGKGALSFIARFGENQGLFNRFNKALFWSEKIANITYPWMHGLRNHLLRKHQISQLDNLNLKAEPIFKSIFNDAWMDLPPVMRKHYLNRPYTNDINTVEGTLDVMCAGPIKLFAPVFWMMGGIPAYNATNVPVTVLFESNKNTKAFIFNRIFHFKDRKPYRFKSHMIQIANNEVVEIMRFGFGWKTSFHWEDNSIKLKHKGYVLSLFGHLIPIPLTLLIGEGNAVETASDENSFDMQMNITHPWWGKIYEYKGHFRLKENA